jgi:hypothetical protein
MKVFYPISNYILLIILSLFLLSASCKKEINTDMPIIEVYVPGDASKIAKDFAIKPNSATASENQPGEDILKALDGDVNTIYHSLWDQSRFPAEHVVIEFGFSSSTNRIDYMLYHPRKDGGVNGFILEAEVFVKLKGQSSFSKYKDLSFGATATTRRIDFSEGSKDIAAIRLVVSKGYNGFVSASEFEFYKSAEISTSDSQFFTDLSFSEIKSGVTRKQLQSIADGFIRNLALAIFDNAYEMERLILCKSFPDRAKKTSLNKTNPGGMYDNITGIHVKKNDELVIFVDELKANMAVRIVDHKKGPGGPDFFLNPGPNRITATSEGLLYLIYETDEKHTAKVNIASGTINGYFDINKHTNAEWDNLINKATYDFFDLKGNKALITFTKNELKKGVTNAKRLVEVYDSLVLLQQEFMGLYKYNRVPENLMYYRTNISPDVYMHAAATVTEYATNTIQEISNFTKVRGGSVWGPAHETGHNNQTRPGLMWIGMAEVTVNIYSLHVQTSFGNPSRLQTEYVPGFGNRYDKAFAQIIDAGIAHNTHDDVFCKLVPFWQLQLYFAKLKGKPDFYKDVHEKIRINPNPENDGLCQLEFVKIACDVSGEDLTEFFEAWGFLKPIDKLIDDYGQRRMLITQAQVDETKQYIAQKAYPKPSIKVQLLTDETSKAN